MNKTEWEKRLCIDCKKPMVEDYPIRPRNSNTCRCKACQTNHRREYQKDYHRQLREETRTAKAVTETPCFNARLIGRLPTPKFQTIMERWTQGEIIFI